MAERVRAMLAVMIDALTLVPLLTVHSLSLVMLSPLTPWPTVNKSGLMLPTPSRRLQVVIPLELNDATFDLDESKLPTPITCIKSPGLFKVP